ncbi:unnamed protein product [Penicillium roqueforti FM164]|uniref:Genomic scaffold, ProqFM164S04 n=1 Tax=Penicillium roqueforti (strain FM164) TaxID=1365484 RepID=W6QFM7_PENRF|nr:unnamed protein product [Penicillium roqueforti FM164]
MGFKIGSWPRDFTHGQIGEQATTLEHDLKIHHPPKTTQLI